MLYRHLKRAGLTLGAIVAASLFFAAGAALRLLMGPISLGPIADAIEDSVNNSLTGLEVRFDQAVLEWSRDDGEINLIIDGTNVFDASGRIIAQAPRSDLDFDLAALLGGKFALKRFTLLDVQLTAVRDAQGALKLGFGPAGGDVDLFEAIRGALESDDGGEGTLETFSISDARLAFHDVETGLFIVSPSANLSVGSDGANFVATVEADVEVSGSPARLAVRAEVDDSGVPHRGTIEVEGLEFAALAQNAERFAFLSAYPLATNLSAEFQLGADGQLIDISFSANGAGAVSPPGLAREVTIDAFALDGRFEHDGNRLTLNSASIDGPDGAATATGAIAFSLEDGALAAMNVDLVAQDVRLNLADVFAEPINLQSVAVAAEYDAATRGVRWSRLSLNGGGLDGTFSGSAFFPEDSTPALVVSGDLAALPVQDLLRFWPITVADGARNWIADNIYEGMVGPFAVSADIPAGALAGDGLPEESVNVVFPIERVTANYLSGLTPATEMRGEAQLSGDTFHLNVQEGRIGPLRAEAGEVTIPNLHIPRPPGDITATVSGKFSEVLELIDMEPLGYPSRFNVDPASVDGDATVALDLTVPMRRDLSVDDVRMAITANAEHVRFPIGQGRILSEARTQISIDNTHLEAEGTGRVNNVPMLFSWQEVFDSGDAYSSVVNVRGTLDEDGREMLRLVAPEWLSGPIAVTATFSGRHLDFEHAEFRTDLTNVVADIAAINFVKDAGQRVSGTGEVAFLDDGSTRFSNFHIEGSGFDILGDMELDRTGVLESLSMPTFRYGAEGDFSVRLSIASDGTPEWHIDGRSVDARRLFSDGEETEGGADAIVADASGETVAKSIGEYDEIEPVAIALRLDTVRVRDDKSLRDVDFRVAIGAKERLKDFHLDAVGPGEGTIEGRMQQVANLRQLTVRSDDAGGFVEAFTGFPSMVGGEIEINARFRPDEEVVSLPPGEDFSGSVSITDFSIVDQPFFARLFSIGSLDGPLRLLAGSGIPFSELETQYVARNRQLALHDGHASGLAVGFSFQGSLDRENDLIDVNGSLIPVFGLNNVLGAIPVIGDLLVSDDNEGIIGLTYQARGAVEEPQIVVNPLSALTPGIFRRIFEFGGAPTMEEAPPPAQVLSNAPKNDAETQTE
jgi:hypothetical protein